MDSILTSIKQLLGIDASYTQFDSELIMHINSAFFPLTQIGIGPATPYSIKDDRDTWTGFFRTDAPNESVKLYIYYKVRLSFDPPASSFVLESIKNQIQELEFRFTLEGGV